MQMFCGMKFFRKIESALKMLAVHLIWFFLKFHPDVIIEDYYRFSRLWNIINL